MRLYKYTHACSASKALNKESLISRISSNFPDPAGPRARQTFAHATTKPTASHLKASWQEEETMACTYCTASWCFNDGHSLTL